MVITAKKHLYQVLWYHKGVYFYDNDHLAEHYLAY